MNKRSSEKNTQRCFIQPNKLLGQNFLRDKNILRKIILAANLTSNDTVLEVGPGEGTLTKELAQVAGRVVAVEKDRALAAQLKIKFANTKNTEIIEGDILKINLQKLLSCHPERSEGSIDSSATPQNDNFSPYKVVANIPYYLTSHLIRLLLEADNPPQDMALMVQKEVAQRICAKPPEMSLLSVSVQFYATPQIIAKIPRGAFYPRPKVDSAIIKIVPSLKHRGADAKNFFRVLHAGFAHPRKQLLNNLSTELKLPRERIGKIIISAGLSPSQRAEKLNIDDWKNLADKLIS